MVIEIDIESSKLLLHILTRITVNIMNGTAMKLVDVSVPFTLDQKEEMIIEYSDDDDSAEDVCKILPSLSGNNTFFSIDSNDEFLRLTTTVRAVYFSYLHKCLISNYVLCYKQKDTDIPCNNLKQCADQLELTAVQRSIEASIYRQNMLKMISDIKSHTSEKKVFKNLVIFLEAASKKIDVGVQTSNPWLVDSDTTTENDSVQNIPGLLSCEKAVDSACSIGIKQDAFHTDSLHCLLHNSSNDQPICLKSNSPDNCQEDNINSSSEFHVSQDNRNQMLLNVNVRQEYQPTCLNEFHTQNLSTLKMQSPSVLLHQLEENSQDSLLQHMEDMFCESDDSTDLTSLIEKHSGVTKANIYNEIRQMCGDTEPLYTSSSYHESEKIKSPKTQPTKPQHVNCENFTFGYCKEIKHKTVDKSFPAGMSTSEALDNTHRVRSDGIWFVERVHQVSKLNAKMTELSLTSCRKHRRVKGKFIDLFGESDVEDITAESPICIEEHLTSCKERIAPWIVKCLMPFYKKKRIKDRQLFKAVAKHIADMLIIENTFPEENCVSKYIENYFKNKKLIKTKQDIYL